jgi:hypothetical protein
MWLCNARGENGAWLAEYLASTRILHQTSKGRSGKCKCRNPRAIASDERQIATDG